VITNARAANSCLRGNEIKKGSRGGKKGIILKGRGKKPKKAWLREGERKGAKKQKTRRQRKFGILYVCLCTREGNITSAETQRGGER